MTVKVHREVVELEALGEARKTTLARGLYAAHVKIFRGILPKDFNQYVMNSGARLTRIAIYRNERGCIIGYCALHFHDREVFQYSKACVIRIQSGMLPEYRGRNRNMPFIIDQLLRYKLFNPRKRLLFLGAMIHPSSYVLLTKYMDNVWPSCDVQDQGYTSFLEHLIEQFDFKRSRRDPLLVDTGVITTGVELERARRAAVGNPDVRFFLERNPEYHKGYGLLTVCPVTLKGLFTAARRFLHEALLKRWQYRKACKD
ncbi:hypothetical protein U6010_11160 [Pseudomonas aeruginosa]|uniref:hypothetical protein n=1 Tax=Pseudomonas aeruginosa TaxID=287 RepID=UPI002ADE31CE|nr:hypothetical protein [Pseudomonas aeruginosa]MEA0989000.1 hypothetical protein [Pseudomonas aeruginosa]HCF3047435.1 hypothetical protein [Pseudomonas aeruginosa]HCL3290474.1 hypothetical protein [Pseudomonas aeruginosa]